MRDTLGHVPSILLRHEIYITASVLGGSTYAALSGFGVDRSAAMVAAFLVTFCVRGLAITFGWSLPVFRQSVTQGRWRNERRH